jgi:hypothetical protein
MVGGWRMALLFLTSVLDGGEGQLHAIVSAYVTQKSKTGVPVGVQPLA